MLSGVNLVSCWKSIAGFILLRLLGSCGLHNSLTLSPARQMAILFYANESFSHRHRVYWLALTLSLCSLAATVIWALLLCQVRLRL